MYIIKKIFNKKVIVSFRNRYTKPKSIIVSVVPKVYMQCPICFETIYNPSIISHVSIENDIPHYFCNECIIKWILQNPNKPTCPLCRNDIVTLKIIPNEITNYINYRVLAKLFMKCGFSFSRFPNKLKNNYNFVAIALSINGLWLQYVKPEFANDLQLVIIAVNQHGRALEFVSSSLLLNKLVVICAVKQCGIALRFAPHFKSDKTVAVIATKSHRWGFLYIDRIFTEFPYDEDIMQALEYTIKYNDNKLF